jgi:hypothetical protein
VLISEYNQFFRVISSSDISSTTPFFVGHFFPEHFFLGHFFFGYIFLLLTFLPRTFILWTVFTLIFTPRAYHPYFLQLSYKRRIQTKVLLIKNKISKCIKSTKNMVKNHNLELLLSNNQVFSFDLFCSVKFEVKFLKKILGYINQLLFFPDIRALKT